jgi:hypothetical protein
VCVHAGKHRVTFRLIRRRRPAHTTCTTPIGRGVRGIDEYCVQCV